MRASYLQRVPGRVAALRTGRLRPGCRRSCTVPSLIHFTIRRGDEAIRLLQEGKVAEADAVLTGFGFQHRIAARSGITRYPTVTNNPGQDKKAAGVNGVGDRAIAFDGVCR